MRPLTRFISPLASQYWILASRTISPQGECENLENFETIYCTVHKFCSLFDFIYSVVVTSEWTIAFARNCIIQYIHTVLAFVKYSSNQKIPVRFIGELFCNDLVKIRCESLVRTRTRSILPPSSTKTKLFPSFTSHYKFCPQILFQERYLFIIHSMRNATVPRRGCFKLDVKSIVKQWNYNKKFLARKAMTRYGLGGWQGHLKRACCNFLRRPTFLFVVRRRKYVTATHFTLLPFFLYFLHNLRSC